jgi:SecD/SecF fusion protein
VSDYFERVEAQINRRVTERATGHRLTRRPRIGTLVPALSVLVALLIAIVFLTTRPAGHGQAGSAGAATALRFVAEPTAAHPRVTPAALRLTVTAVKRRLAALGVAPGAQVRSDAGTIVVRLPAGAHASVILAALLSNPRMDVYDWEADALVPPGGESVASELHSTGAAAGRISQGSGAAAPGGSEAASGAVGLFEAVRLAAKQPARAFRHVGRYGSEYFLFGAPGSSACASAAAAHGTRPVPGVHCLLDSPPLEEPPGTSREKALRDLAAALPRGVTRAGGRLFVVRQGTAVLQGAPASFSRWLAYGSPAALYYVVRDDVALTAADITNPHQSRGSDGAPDVEFGFTRAGGRAFERLTAQVARRGSLDSVDGRLLMQHFAIAIGDQLITVPYIDYKLYPAGISGDAGAELSGNFTVAEARHLAALLRVPALPLRLVRDAVR